jgi:hypothetical protein
MGKRLTRFQNLIIVKLQGGLGNQMFQYAFAKALSLKLRVEFFLDCSFFNQQEERLNFTPRTFELILFNIKSSIASTDQLLDFKAENFSNKIRRKLNLIHYKCFCESTFSFNDTSVSIKAPVYVDGYWQSEKYFIDFKKEIAEDFSFTQALDERNEIMLNKIKSTNSVSIHVRRGDFIKSTNNFNFHGVCSLQYYQNAITTILGKQKDVEFFVFSDEPEWVEKHLLGKVNKITLVTNNIGNDSWKDMYLMKECKHNIIANSSFSWWGAWLNSNPDKLVIAPKRWFATTDPFWDYKDIVPSSWLKLNNE